MVNPIDELRHGATEGKRKPRRSGVSWFVCADFAGLFGDGSEKRHHASALNFDSSMTPCTFWSHLSVAIEDDRLAWIIEMPSGLSV